MNDKTYNKTCATREDSDQPAHLGSLISLFADRMCLQAIQRESLPYWVDVQTDLSLCLSHLSYCRFCHALAQFMAWQTQPTYYRNDFSVSWILLMGKNWWFSHKVTKPFMFSMVNVLKFRILYSILFWSKFCFLWTCFLKYLVEWQTV